MKKRILSTLIILSLSVLLLAGCGSSKPTSEPENTETTVSVEPETTPTPEAEPETTEDTKETEVVETTETETQAEETEESPAYTFTDLDATKYAKSSVNVRSLPDTSGDKLGGLNTNDEVHVTGQCNETGWFRFEYNGGTAYVSNSYLVSEKVSVAPPADNGGSGNNGGQSSGKHTPEGDGYSEGIWYDMGVYAFKVCSPSETATKSFSAEDMNWGDSKGCIGGFIMDVGRLVKYAYPPNYAGTSVCDNWM